MPLFALDAMMAFSHYNGKEPLGKDMISRKPMQLRLPEELKNWIKAEAVRNGSSQNSEVVRAIRTVKDATAKMQKQSRSKS